jgi:hypothetical protein
MNPLWRDRINGQIPDFVIEHAAGRRDAPGNCETAESGKPYGLGGCTLKPVIGKGEIPIERTSASGR